MSNGSNTNYIFAPQTGFGVPADNAATWTRQRFDGGGIKRATQQEDDPEIGPNAPSSVTSEAAAAGTINMGLWYGMADHWFENIFGGTWTADVLTSGSILRYVSIEEEQPDLVAGDTFTSFPDTVPTSYTLTFPVPGRVSMSVALSAARGVEGATSLNDGGAAVQENVHPVMRTGSLLTNLTIDGNPISTYNLRCSNLEITTTRETTDEPQIDLDGRGNITYGDFTTELTMTTYDEDRTVLNSLFANQSRDIGWSIRDINGRGYDFLLSSASPNGGEVSDPAKNTSRTQTLPYSGAGFSITRVP